MGKSQTGELKFIAKPLGILVTILLLYIGLVMYGFGQINSINNKLAELNKESLVLSQKLSILSSVDENIGSVVNSFDVALPNKSSVLYALNQIRRIAVSNNLQISNILSLAPTSIDKDIIKIPITFDLEGADTDIFSFLNSLNNVLPLMNISKIGFSKQALGPSASVTIDVYSAPLPKVIPSLTTAVTDLTSDEMELIKELSTYSMPTFTETKPQTVEGKTDPFN